MLYHLTIVHTHSITWVLLLRIKLVSSVTRESFRQRLQRETILLPHETVWNFRSQHHGHHRVIVTARSPISLMLSHRVFFVLLLVWPPLLIDLPIWYSSPEKMNELWASKHMMSLLAALYTTSSTAIHLPPPASLSSLCLNLTRFTLLHLSRVSPHTLPPPPPPPSL